MARNNKGTSLKLQSQDYSLDNSPIKQDIEELKKLFKKSDRSNRLQEYISQPNVQAFNLSVLENGFNKIIRNKYDVSPLFTNDEYAINEIKNYFKMCGETKTFPSVASFCAYSGVSKEELFHYINHPEISPTSKLLKEFISNCHSLLENATLNDKVDSRLYAVLSSNYYGIINNSTLYVAPALENKGNFASQSVEVIKEQMKLTSPKD